MAVTALQAQHAANDMARESLGLPLRAALRASLVLTERSANDTEMVRHALAKQMYRDPKLANEAVTGACEWQSGKSSDALDTLALEAADAAYDLEQARDLGIPISVHRIDRLRAAEQAFLWLSADAAEAEKAVDDWAEDRGGLPYNSFGRRV